MFKGFNNACDWSFSFPCHHLLILSRCFMAISRLWRTDRKKTLPISFVWDCEFLTQMVDSHRLANSMHNCLYPQKESKRAILSTPKVLSVKCLWLGNRTRSLFLRKKKVPPASITLSLKQYQEGGKKRILKK